MSDFPKWVPVHKDHMRTNNMGHYVPHGFADYHWDRIAKRFMVLVNSAGEEARANPVEQPVEPPVEPTEAAP